MKTEHGTSSNARRAINETVMSVVRLEIASSVQNKSAGQRSCRSVLDATSYVEALLSRHVGRQQSDFGGVDVAMDLADDVRLTALLIDDLGNYLDKVIEPR